MTLRRINRRKGDNHNNQPQHHQPQQPGKQRISPSKNLAPPSDYESDLPDEGYLADLNYSTNDDQMGSLGAPDSHPQQRKPAASNEEMNLMVLKRYNPAIATILSIAPHAVVYLFNSTTQLWEKENVGIEGTLFICQWTPGELGEDRYSVLVLNRRGLQNFEAQLSDGEDVKITEDYVILRVADGRTPGSHDVHNIENKVDDSSSNPEFIYGLWIFSEPPPSSTAETRELNSKAIKEFATQGAQSRKAAVERQKQGQNAPQQTAGEYQPQGAGPLGGQVSLQALFEQQRAQDSQWSVHAHGQQPTVANPAASAPPAMPTSDSQDKAGNDVLGDLFRKAGMTYQNSR